MSRTLSLAFIIIVFVLGYFTRDFINDSSQEENQEKSHDTTVTSPPDTTVRITAKDTEIINNAANLKGSRSMREIKEELPDMNVNPAENPDSSVSVSSFGKIIREFDKEEREEIWSQDQEFFISESLKSQQFADTFDIKELTCKASICKLIVYKSTADLYSDRNIPEADWHNIVKKSSADIDMNMAQMEVQNAPDSESDVVFTVYFKSKSE